MNDERAMFDILHRKNDKVCRGGLMHPASRRFETRHMLERCGTEALIGSMCLLAMMRLTLPPSDDKAS